MLGRRGENAETRLKLLTIVYTWATYSVRFWLPFSWDRCERETKSRKKLLCFQRKTDTCGRGVVERERREYCSLVKGATSRLVHLEKFSLNFSSWSFAIRVNLLHPWPSLFLLGLFLPLWCLSTPASYYLKVLFYLKATLYDAKNESKRSSFNVQSIKIKCVAN